MYGIQSFFSLFSVYPYTGNIKDVEIVVIDAKVSVRITDVKWLNTIIVQWSHSNINYIIRTVTVRICYYHYQTLVTGIKYCIKNRPHMVYTLLPDRLPKYGTKMAASATAIRDSVISVTVWGSSVMSRKRGRSRRLLHIGTWRRGNVIIGVRL